ncbi:MAG: YfaZ family outer membrane protein [Arcobacteraceae bacterium]|nr:YfaZ family outer membrane protein [Arcobacteraceae bacterium]
MIKKIILGSLVASSCVFASGAADININNNTLEVGMEYNLNGTYRLNENSNYLFTASYLRSEEVSSINTQTLLTAGLKVVNPYVDDYGFSLGLGIKAVVADNSSQRFVAAPLGLFASYMVNEQVHIDAEYNYAPKVLAFSDGETYKEWKAKANYRVIDNGFVYIGARGITTKYTNGSELSYDRTAFFGFNVQF